MRPDDLRSVLRRIAQDGAAQKEETGAKSAAVPKQEGNERADLKNALSAALGGAPTSVPVPEMKTEPTPQPTRTETLRVEPVPPAAAIPPAPRVAEGSATPKVSRESAPAPASANSNITPKELERMMRVATSDKPPV
jgi:hypothetical protein